MREDILLVTIKPHSSLRKYFAPGEIKADLTSYMDIMYYVNSMHPRFTNYLRNQRANQLEESIVFLDKNLHIISPDEFGMRRAKKGDIIHIVPAIVGGGGKRGGILAVLAVAAFLFIGLPMLGGLMAGSSGAAVAGTAAAHMAGVEAGAAVAAHATMGGIFQTLVTNLSLSLLAAAFSPKPKAAESTRQNDMFGSLTNTTSSDTSVALHYGLVRVAGNMISGYIKTLANDADTIKVSDQTTI